MNVTVAVLAAVDVAPYRALMLHAYEQAADAFTSTPEERAREPDAWWDHRLCHPEGLSIAFGAFEGAQLVGTVALEFSAKAKTKHKALVVGMYVLPAWRGKGLGRKLLQAALALCARREGIALVQLEVTEGNAPAVALYASLGFETYGVETMAVLTPTGFKSKIHMAHSLASRPIEHEPERPAQRLPG